MKPEQPNLESKPETIECAVIVYRGENFTGTSHHDAILKLADKYPDWSESIDDQIQDGFMTNTGRVVDREEAGRIAKKSMQLEHLTLPTQDEAAGNFDSEYFPTNWIRPNLMNEIGELSRVLREFLQIEPSRENMIELAEALESAPMVELTEELWERLENTDSYHNVGKDDFKKIESLIEESNQELPEDRRRNVESIIAGFHNNNPMEVPTILQNREGRIHLISGNTRLMIARALGVRPQVIIAKM